MFCVSSYSFSSLKRRHSAQCLKITQNVAFQFWHFSTNFWPIKTDMSGNSVWPKASDFQKLVKLTIFGIFDDLLSTQNVNVARFARNVEWDFFVWFSNTLKYLQDSRQKLSDLSFNLHALVLTQHLFLWRFCVHCWRDKRRMVSITHFMV